MKDLIFVKELCPVYDRRASFYHKANIYRDDKGNLYLKSYETIVAQITDKMMASNNEMQVKVFGWYSSTTARHINEFLQQYGFSKMSKKEMERGEI